MRRYGLVGIVALVGMGIALTATFGVRIGELGSLDEQQWLGIGA